VSVGRVLQVFYHLLEVIACIGERAISFDEVVCGGDRLRSGCIPRPDICSVLSIDLTNCKNSINIGSHYREFHDERTYGIRHSRRDSDGEGLPIGIKLSRSLRRQLLSIRRPTAFGKSWHTETRRVVVLMVGTYS
jgi:hypothetical protein